MLRKTEDALRERVKELSCLYSITQIAEIPNTSLEHILQQVVELLPPAWQYPEITVGRIVLDKQIFTTFGFKDDGDKQSARLMVAGKDRGSVDVFYLSKKPELDYGPFLEEERNLINAISKQIAFIVEQKETEEEKQRLQDQLRHADRLATIGQLAAGVAHELNEPLGNILGFAQLAMKAEQVPDQVVQDLLKIEDASLYAREIIRKLLIFGRQIQSSMSPMPLHQSIENGLFFFAARCTKAGIKLIQNVSPSLPEICADSSQINQILVNLVVNSIQAMPEGGTLTITATLENDMVVLGVEDTGTGIQKENLDNIFLPFFTTKDIGEGTGLGLAVVHGIVSAHGGSIRVTSEVSQGTIFEVCLPVKNETDSG